MAIDLAAVEASVSATRDSADAAITALSAFRPAVFAPNTVAAPTLTAAGSVTPATIGAVTPVTTTLTAPDTYTPLAPADLGTLTIEAFDDSLTETLAAALTGLASTFSAAPELEELTSLLGSWVNSSALTDLNPAGITAIMDIGLEKSDQSITDAFAISNAMTGAKGFRFPNSITSAQQTEFTLNAAWMRADQVRQNTKELASTVAGLIERSLANQIEFAIASNESKLKVAGLQVQIAEAKQRLIVSGQEVLLNAHRTSAEIYRTKAQTKIQEFEAKIQAILADLGVQKTAQENLREYVAAQRDQIRLESQIGLAEFEAANRAEVMRVETDKMIEELKLSGNEQAIRLFAAEIQQHVALVNASIQDIQTENTLAARALEATANFYSKLVEGITAQGVAIDITKH